MESGNTESEGSDEKEPVHPRSHEPEEQEAQQPDPGPQSPDKQPVLPHCHEPEKQEPRPDPGRRFLDLVHEALQCDYKTKRLLKIMGLSGIFVLLLTLAAIAGICFCVLHAGATGSLLKVALSVLTATGVTAGGTAFVKYKKKPKELSERKDGKKPKKSSKPDGKK